LTIALGIEWSILPFVVTGAIVKGSGVVVAMGVEGLRALGEGEERALDLVVESPCERIVLEAE
jgi:hypothetical protein